MNWLKRLMGSSPTNPPGPTTTVNRESAGLYVMTVRGTFTKQEADSFQQMMKKDINQGSTDLCVLAILDGFSGWERTNKWNDMSFYETYQHHIAKIAVVGDPKWETETLMFLGAGLRKGEVRFFPENRKDHAILWLNGK